MQILPEIGNDLPGESSLRGCGSLGFCALQPDSPYCQPYGDPECYPNNIRNEISQLTVAPNIGLEEFNGTTK